MRQWCHHWYNLTMNQVSQGLSVYFLYISYVTVIDVFHRTFHRTNYIHISSCQTYGIHTFCLQTGHNILVDKSAVNHRYHLQGFCIGNTTSIYHLAFNSQLRSNTSGRASSSMHQHLIARQR